MDTIIIKGLELDAIIGVYEHERTAKQKIVIDIKMQYDSTQAVATDNIKYALDYHKITTDIVDFVSASNFQLIETLAHAIADRIIHDNNIKNIELTLWKPDALQQVDNVGITLSKRNVMQSPF